MNWLKKAGFGLRKALGSTVAIELLGTVAKSQSDLPPEVIEGAKLATQLLILYKLAFNNPDGTPASEPHTPSTQSKGN